MEGSGCDGSPSAPSHANELLNDGSITGGSEGPWGENALDSNHNAGRAEKAGTITYKRWEE